MASPPTSSHLWWFIDSAGNPIDRPAEWINAYVEVDVDSHEWESVEVRVQGVALSVQARKVGDRARVVVPWERSPAGRYRIEVTTPVGSARQEVVVRPTKISQTELDAIVVDLETRLAPTIALALQRMGAFAGLKINPPGDTTLAAEMQRVRVAVKGDDRVRGLLSLMGDISRDPHRRLHANEPWVKTERARRPSPTRLAAAFAKPDNLGVGQRPLAVADRRVEHTYDVYENRLLKLYLARLDARLRRLRSVATDLAKDALAAEAYELHQDLERKAASATFLREVAVPAHGPSQVSMVLLKRPDYRAMLASYKRFHRHMTVVLDDPLLDAPLSDVPNLYELWGTLKAAESLVAVAAELGFQVTSNELVRRRAGDLRLVSRGANLRLTHPETGVVVVFREQSSYVPSGSGLRSITFSQVPDISVEIRRHGSPIDLYLFDPKYKVQPKSSGDDDQDGDVELFPGGPKKVDIDKMHAYRDAIRRSDGSRAVRYAAILYPGEERSFTDGLAALQCRPAKSAELGETLGSLMGEWLS